MDTRRRWVFGAFLVLAGAGLWMFVVAPILGPSQRTWQAQIELDSVPLTQALRYDVRLERVSQFDAAWAKRRVLYDEAHLADLRERLLTFVDFQVAEYADAKQIYLAGSRPETPSAAASAVHQRLAVAFPGEAATWISQFKQNVREAAYTASPAVAHDVDPDLPKYDSIYDDVVTKWLPKAKARVAELTRSP